MITFLSVLLFPQTEREQISSTLDQAKTQYEAFLETENQESLDQAILLLRESLQKFNSGLLEYNLGNMLYLKQDYPQALLHYYRAEKWIPQDQKLRLNMAYARKRLGIKEPDSIPLDFIFFWKDSFAFPLARMLFIAGWNLLWMLSVFLLVFPSIRKKILLRTSFFVFAAIFTYYGIGFAYNYYQKHCLKWAVVQKENAELFRDPSTSYPENKIAGTGEKVRLESELGNWAQIRFQGKKLWILKKNIEMI